MSRVPLDPPVADEAPHADALTSYDQEHFITYLRLLDADAEGADWTEVARIVLHIDPAHEPERRAAPGRVTRARQMDDRARLSTPSAQRHAALILCKGATTVQRTFTIAVREHSN